LAIAMFFFSAATVAVREMIEFLTQMPNGTKISLTMAVLGLAGMLIALG
jgi:hypothetical protein